ncbi:MAG: hypothetical protein Q9170_003335 [Blastenia crenularia]
MMFFKFSYTNIFGFATALRVAFFIYGLLQDKYAPVKYTDIDYFVFTDAARYISQGRSPYERETYRYTPLLAWLLIPTSWQNPVWFSFGKILFAVSDIIAGWFIVRILQSKEAGAMSTERALKYASIWLLNPMVATISTRGSSEGLLGVMVIVLSWAVTRRQIVLSGVLLGLAVHFKIYPFIYGPSIVWFLESLPTSNHVESQPSTPAGGFEKAIISTDRILDFFNRSRITFCISSLATFAALNLLMYHIYSTPFFQHTFLYHITRIDHRHNFSPYNTLLHLSSAMPDKVSSLKLESLALIPQLLISAVLIPLVLAKKDLAGTMLAQTFAFVAFNKVCTSQYFLWYLILLPFYLPYSSFLAKPQKGITALFLWVVAQAIWLHQAYRLEFLGLSTFVPGLFVSGLAFFAVNMWILGNMVEDIGGRRGRQQLQKKSVHFDEVNNDLSTLEHIRQIQAEYQDAWNQNSYRAPTNCQKATIMTLDRPSKPLNARPSTTAIAPKWAARSTAAPSILRSPTTATQSTLRREGQGSRNSGAATDDTVTPVKAFLSSNVTPRSGSRKARVDSASSTPRRTPESTPPAARPTSMIEGRDWPSRGLKPVGALGTKEDDPRPTRAQSVVSDVQHPTRLTSVDRSRDGRFQTSSADNLPKFFHASDAKPSCSTRPQSQSPRLQPRLAGFEQAKDLNNADIYTETARPEPGDERPKFFHADETQPASPAMPKHVNGRPPLQTIFSSYQTMSSPVQRPPSPLKEEVLPISRKSSLSKPSPRRHTRLVSAGFNDIRAPEILVKGISRRSSLNDSSKRITQPQSPVTASFGAISSRRSSFALSDAGRRSTFVMPPDPDHPDPSTAEARPTTPPKPHSSGSPDTPAPGQSKLDHLNELAANARRERKVLDLEISNSSLLAINRTLEAEMRKQKAELRHLRRLRSSVRFPSSTRTASSKFSMPSADDDLSPTSSADEAEDDNDRFSNISSGTSDDTSFPDSLSFSPSFRKSSIPVAKGRTSRSLKVDLSAQRLLLLDSQKLNQALKRCLGRTDELITDGKRALDYKVDTGDLPMLGPRVLTSEDRDEELELGRGLLSPGLYEHTTNPWERARKVGDSWNVPRPGNSDGLVLEIPEREDGAGMGDDQQKHGEQVLYESSPQSGDGNLHEDLGIDTGNEMLAPDSLEPHSAEAFLPDKLPASNHLEIPYEDPGIDTGSETPAPEDDNKRADLLPQTQLASQVSRDPSDTSPESPTTATAAKVDSSITEPSTSEYIDIEGSNFNSPGKSLGDFLRMVGGSWGV